MELEGSTSHIVGKEILRVATEKRRKYTRKNMVWLDKVLLESIS